MGSDVAYNGLVKAARGLVLVEQMKKATDNTQRAEIAAKSKALATSN